MQCISGAVIELLSGGGSTPCSTRFTKHTLVSRKRVDGTRCAESTNMKTRQYTPSFKIGARVRFIGTDSPSKTGEQCTIIRILPNPSELREHQWYDIKFEDGSLGRFLEKYLTVTTQEIPSRNWAEFFESFGRRHENWLVQLESFSADKAQRLASRNLRLKSIAVEPSLNGGRERETMIVIVGEDETTEVSQLIRKPSRVLLSETEVGADKCLEIYSEDFVFLMRFRSATLPELVDDVA